MPKGLPLVSALAAFVEALHSPSRAFARQLSAPSFLVPLVLLGAAAIGLALLQAPITLDWVERQMEARGSRPEEMAPHLDSFRSHSVVGAAVAPVILLLKWTVFALLLWLTAQLLLGEVPFRSALNLVAYGYAPLLLRDACIYLVLALRDPEVLARKDGLDVALGLNLLFPSLRLPWSALLANINLFEAWFVGILIFGLASIARTRWQRAAAVVLPNWLLVVLLQLGLASAGMRLQAGLG